MDILGIAALHLYCALCVFALFVCWSGKSQKRIHRWIWFCALLVIQSGVIWHVDLDWTLVVIIVLTAYVVFVPWQPTVESRQVGLIWFLALPVVVFVAFQYAGRLSWDLAFWLFYGDEYDSRDPDRIAIVIAFFTSVIVFIRLAIGRAGLRYRVVTLVGSVGLLGLFFGDRIIHFAARIEGSAAQSAAQDRFESESKQVRS
jgi:hypothetical protein